MADPAGAGPLLDALGVTLDLEDGQQLTEAIILGKVIDFTDDEPGRAGLIISKSSIDWISQRSLLSAAQRILAAEPFDE